jgi:ribosomal protein S18 acetylase RimI-like enzyme
MTPDLRLATLDDLHAVEAVVHAAYSHYVIRIGRKPGPMLDDYAELIGNRSVHVIEHGDTVKGILVLIPDEHSMLLDNIAVAPDAQGLGLGRIMLDFAERSAVAAGYDAVTLYTNEAMSENIALYSRLGYAETHRREEKGLRRIYMRKSLV